MPYFFVVVNSRVRRCLCFSMVPQFYTAPRALNKFLMDKKIIEKQGETYVPLQNQDLFIIEKYRGKISGLKFRNSFIDWLEKAVDNKVEQDELF